MKDLLKFVYLLHGIKDIDYFFRFVKVILVGRMLQGGGKCAKHGGRVVVRIR
jgi:hypothetical protein